jgi:non-ribosomal peptide synthetase component F
VLLDADWDEIAREEVSPLPELATAENLVYVTYTSGSTGRPKGIAMHQGPLLNLLNWQLQTTDLPSGARTLQFASLSFDVSFQDMFSTWLAGGTVVMISRVVRQDMTELARVIIDEGINRLFIPAVALQQLAEGLCAQSDPPTSLLRVIAGSEQLQITHGIAKMFRQLSGCSLHNEYGPSETHVVTALDMPPDLDG